MDFITQLPKTKGGHDAVVVFVDCLTKMVHLAATTIEVSVEGVADLLVQHVVKHHGLPSSIVLDRDARFISKFYQHLTARWGVQLRMSTAYHPQTDGQTEVMNWILEDYLHSYTRSSQDQWDELLAMAEFAMNNSKNSFTNETPFYLNYVRHPKSPLALGVEIWKLMKGYDNPNAHGLAVAINRAQQPKLRRNGKSLMESVLAVIWFDERIQSALKEARECLQRAQNR